MTDGKSPEDIWHIISEQRRMMRDHFRRDPTSYSVRREMSRRQMAQKQDDQTQDV